MQARIPKLGRVWVSRDRGQAYIPGNLMWATSLKVRHIRNGEVLEERDLGSGVITLAGVTLLAAGATNLYAFNYHDSGTGNNAPQTSDTALQLPIAANARVTGFQTSIANVYTTVASITYNSAFSVVEWGIFTAATNGTMWDRRTFTAIPVLTNDILQFTYALTCVAGG